ncbi:MAG: DegV family protein [Bacilli bacterium]
MKKYIILPDVTCDLSLELREKFGLQDYIKGHINLPDGSERVSSLEWDWVKPEEFYKLLKDKKNGIATSPSSVDEIENVFEKYIDKGYDILSMSISSGLSGTYNFSLKAREEILSQHPSAKIICIDSKRYSTAFGLLVCTALNLQKEGKTIEEVASFVENNKNLLHQMGPMDDLFFLASKGRVSGGKAFMGSLIGIRPMGDFNDLGMTTVLVKVKGKAAALDTTIKYIKETIIKPEEQYIFIAHTDREKEANIYKEKILDEFKPKDVFVTECFPSCGTNIGPGLCGVYYYGKPLSENLIEEKKIMDKITGKE